MVTCHLRRRRLEQVIDRVAATDGRQVILVGPSVAPPDGAQPCSRFAPAIIASIDDSVASRPNPSVTTALSIDECACSEQ